MIEYIHGPRSPETVLARLADSATRIVSLTITEGGYNIDEMSGAFRLDAPDIRLDMTLRPRQVLGDFSLPSGMSLDQYEQEIIKQALKKADGNKSQAARLLGLTRNALRYRLTQMGIEA